MADQVFGNVAEVRRFDWQPLLAKFPIRSDEFTEKLEPYFDMAYADDRFSKKYSVYYSDFKISINPELFTKFSDKSIFEIFENVIDYTLASAVHHAFEQTNGT